MGIYYCVHFLRAEFHLTLFNVLECLGKPQMCSFEQACGNKLLCTFLRLGSTCLTSWTTQLAVSLCCLSASLKSLPSFIYTVGRHFSFILLDCNHQFSKIVKICAYICSEESVNASYSVAVITLNFVNFVSNALFNNNNNDKEKTY